MARYRTLKPETFSDEKLAEVSRDCRLLFIGLWCFCDDMGRKAYSARRIQLELFPADEDLSPQLVGRWIHELERVDLIRLYEANSKEYIWIPHFLRHQRIDRPSHSYLPPHPDDPDPDCCCANCRIAAGDTSLIRHDNERFEPHNYSRKQKSNSNRTTSYSGGSVPRFTRGGLGEHSSTRGAVEEASGRSVVELNQSQNQIQHQHQEQHQPQEQEPHLSREEKTKAEKGRAERREVDEIAIRMVSLLNLPDSPLLLQTLTKSIEIKARSRNASVEWAGQHILGKAAVIAAESPPDNWTQWLFDSRYEYLIPGDPRLKDRRIEARPTCGGSRCSEGWEMVKVGDDLKLRRCPDCERAWRDAGL